jgi:hypothetical protein
MFRRNVSPPASVFLRTVLQLLVTANVHSSLTVRLMEALRSSETSILTRSTQPRIPEDGIPH